VNVRLPSNNTASKLVFAAAILGFCGVFIAKPFYIACAVFVVLAIASAVLPPSRKGSEKRWLARAHDYPILLHPPFLGEWSVTDGGPDTAHNHHSEPDQIFGYDFLPADGEAWDRAVLAPCNGMVAHVEGRCEDAPASERGRDPKAPLGNYVAIEVEHGGFVLLAHLRKGSIVVSAGAEVRVGDEIARVGNSGNSNAAHLHVHAQDVAFADVGVAKGLPISFVDRDRTKPILLEYRDSLTNSG
jgi:hypothetical protein